MNKSVMVGIYIGIIVATLTLPSVAEKREALGSSVVRHN